MLRIALDTDAVNRIADSDEIVRAIGIAAERSRLIIIGNHVVRDQLAATRDLARKAQLLKTYDSLPKRDVATEGSLWGISAWGESSWGDGAHTGISLSEAWTGGRGGGHDALIATTAAGNADILVTDDADLAKKISRSSAVCLVWSFADFCQFLTKET